MQDKCLLAFRKRLNNCGYTHIHIKKSNYFDGFYDVSAVEPLGHTTIKVRMSIGECCRFKSKEEGYLYDFN